MIKLNCKMVKIKALICILFFCIISIFSNSVLAQDSRFTQFWSAPMTVNPAWAGTVPHWRASVLYRQQWYGVNGGIQSFFGGFDYNLGTGRGALGGWIKQDRISSLNANNLEVAAIYSYRVQFDNDWQLSMAGQLSYGQKTQGMDGLRFEDAMLSGNITAEDFGNYTIHYPDFGAGFVAYNSKMWIGLAAYHLLKPDISVTNIQDQIPVRITAQAGYRIALNDEHTLVPSGIIQYQSPFLQVDAGLNWEWDFLYTGIWYRGLPTRSGTQLLPSSALAVVSGVKIENWQFGVSYDFALASLVGVGGSYEISLTYMPKYDLRRSARGREEVKCPINFR
ncbi:Bacteroidetes-specific putative membrane protein [Bernardetia litoralis DSM 6794]|uniref:Bacteroidetes-specific putative membrane protein n=1 Tax=Bernardetia litoralis (strain ATCC 23117 / DSM 6794 / NBRC 15988 / NCIMB 1366 / Fx l1 / Sio-4) TaxID=880071 RepID=I4AKI5_BERLS|nr:PorP/SprF family type IX secretion system membrane protein [Bernardetia litoralis]AFM04470.1 Bacteroidetes-specific putative membrane protein [Bernardetia litoralis DSM 6794]